MEDRIMQITQTEQQQGKRILKNEESLKDLWNNIKHTNIHIIEVPGGEERERKGKKTCLKK